MKFCPQCGKGVGQGSRFCEECGASLAAGPIFAAKASPTPQPSQGGDFSFEKIPQESAPGWPPDEPVRRPMSYFPKEDILEQPAARSTHRPSMRHEITAEAEYAFLGKNADYYVDEWSKIKEGSKVSFNLWACLLGPAWLAYRKMYLYTVLFVVFLELQVIAELSVGKLSPITQLVQTVITMGAFALYGNYAYLNFSREKIRNILSQKNGISVDEALEKAGGVNKWAPWAVVLFVLAFAVILSIIFPEKV